MMRKDNRPLSFARPMILVALATTTVAVATIQLTPLAAPRRPAVVVQNAAIDPFGQLSVFDRAPRPMPDR